MPAKKATTKTTTKTKKTSTAKTAKVKAEKPETKKAENASKNDGSKKAAVSKTTAAKTSKKKTTTEKEPKKAAAKKAGTAAAKNAEKKTAAKKTTVKKAETKKTETKKTETKKKETTAKKKTTTKKATSKKAVSKVNKEKLDSYNSFALETCIEMAKAMGVQLDYDQYSNMLLDDADVKALSKKVLADFNVDAGAFSFDNDGYDTDLIEVIFNRVAETTDIKASDFVKIEKEIKKHIKYTIKDDSTANNEEYQADFDLVRDILMIAQRKDVHQTEDMKAYIQINPSDMIEKFMDLAYNVLVLFEYDDVKFYENFIYAVLSQFDDLHEKWGTRAMMDIADLYIKHGDYGLGDANYNYVLRENQIKDYIYYRFAKVYYDEIDRDKAKAIANGALQFVDDRFTYYNNIIEILEN